MTQLQKERQFLNLIFLNFRFGSFRWARRRLPGFYGLLSSLISYSDASDSNLYAVSYEVDGNLFADAQFCTTNVELRSDDKKIAFEVSIRSLLRQSWEPTGANGNRERSRNAMTGEISKDVAFEQVFGDLFAS